MGSGIYENGRWVGMGRPNKPRPPLPSALKRISIFGRGDWI